MLSGSSLSTCPQPGGSWEAGSRPSAAEGWPAPPGSLALPVGSQHAAGTRVTPEPAGPLPSAQHETEAGCVLSGRTHGHVCQAPAERQPGVWPAEALSSACAAARAQSAPASIGGASGGDTKGRLAQGQVQPGSIHPSSPSPGQERGGAAGPGPPPWQRFAAAGAAAPARAGRPGLALLTAELFQEKGTSGQRRSCVFQTSA